MSIVISVEKLGKKYTLRHQQREQYTALRDVITDGVISFGKRSFHHSLFTIQLHLVTKISGLLKMSPLK